MPQIPDSPSEFLLPIQTEQIAFDAADLIECEGCSRKNPPNRLKCIYCGSDLKIDARWAASVKPNGRKLEPWENGYNLVFVPDNVPTAIDIAAIAKVIAAEPAMFADIVASENPLPFARVETDTEAEILRDELARLGLESLIVSDGELAADKPPVRLGGMQFLPGELSLKDFNTGRESRFKAENMALVVIGLITETRVDSLETKGRRATSKPIEETATASDELVFDLYSQGDPVGFRLQQGGFDFSCLEDEKTLLAAENIKRLLARLKERCPNVKVATEYKTLRAMLGHTWELDYRNDPKGIQNIGFGKRAFGNVATASNLRQFTKYSRLKWRLL